MPSAKGGSPDCPHTPSLGVLPATMRQHFGRVDPSAELADAIDSGVQELGRRDSTLPFSGRTVADADLDHMAGAAEI
jgi:hypothetical protein